MPATRPATTPASLSATDDAPSPALSAALDAAHRLADAARAETLPLFRSPGLALANKADGAAFDPVTAADKAAERAMRDILAELRPDDGVLGEEYGAVEGASGLTWVLDPIDGTRAFMSGVPLWGTLIALNADGRPFLGVVDQAYLEERYVGWRDPETGRTAAWVFDRRGARPVATRPCPSLDQATLFSTAPELFSTPEDRAAFDRVTAAARLTRYGTDCYGYAMLAAGQADLVVEAGLAPYDVQAPIALIEAAGGVVTDWSGGPAQNGGRICAAGDPALHAQALERLAAR